MEMEIEWGRDKVRCREDREGGSEGEREEGGGHAMEMRTVWDKLTFSFSVSPLSCALAATALVDSCTTSTRGL